MDRILILPYPVAKAEKTATAINKRMKILSGAGKFLSKSLGTALEISEKLIEGLGDSLKDKLNFYVAVIDDEGYKRLSDPIKYNYEFEEKIVGPFQVSILKNECRETIFKDLQLLLKEKENLPKSLR